jgi:threonine dehydrogenase-like Zn-dependent dehydrogenase
LFLSDVLPTAWQALTYAGVPEARSVVVVVLGLGPIGDMSCRVAVEMGAEKVIAIELVPERLEGAGARGIETLDLSTFATQEDVVDAVRCLTALLPDAMNERLMLKAGVDRLAALQLAIELVRRGGTMSIIGVYGGMTDPLPMMTLFDKQIQLRMGQANVKRWVDEVMPLLSDTDPLGLDGFATHHLPLHGAGTAYEMFQKKHDGAVKVLFKP